MPVIDNKPPHISSALDREISATQKAIASTQEELSKCGLFDAAVGTKAALTAELGVERKRLASLALSQSQGGDSRDERGELRRINNSQKEERAVVNAAMSNAVSHAKVAHGSARFVNEVGTASVEMAATVVAGPAVGVTVGLGIRGVSNLGQTIVEKQIGSETHFGERLVADTTGAAFGFAGGKAGQFAASAVHATGGRVVAAVGTSLAGGVTKTTFDVGQEMAHRISAGGEALQPGDAKRWGIQAAAQSAAWALGDHSGKFTATLSQVSKGAVSAVGSAAIAVTADYAQSGEVSAATLAHGVSSAMGGAAAAHHLASRHYQVAPVTGVSGRMPADITPAGHKALSLRNEGNGVASIHLENVGALVKGEVTVPTIRNEFASLMKAATADPAIQTVRVSSPLLAKMSADGASATLRPLGKSLMEQYGGSPRLPELTPDFQKVGISVLEVAKAVPQMRLQEPLQKLGEHEYTAGFDIPTKEPK